MMIKAVGKLIVGDREEGREMRNNEKLILFLSLSSVLGFVKG